MTHDIRVSQAMTVFGPGAIVDIGDSSFVNCTIDLWSDPSNNHHAYTPCPLKRLADKLGVDKFWQPSTLSSGFGRNPPASIRMHRFPSWMFCQSCRRMHRWSWEQESNLEDGAIPTCGRCASRRKKRPLVPMRWVKACEFGHLDDIDWNYELHKDASGCTNRRPDSLSFTSSRTRGSGLDALEVRCEECGTRRTIKQLIASVSGARCHGRQPWMRRSDETSCEGHWKVSQRGDSNVHFALVASALDIPDGESGPGLASWEDWDGLLSMFRQLKSMQMEDRIVEAEICRRAAEATGETEATILDALRKEDGEESSGSTGLIEEPDLDEIKIAEYPVLRSPDGRKTSQFSGRSYIPDASNFGSTLAQLVKSVSLLDRLREVRAFRGFHRLNPGDSDRMIHAGGGRQWMPAFEVFGEGIFLDFCGEFIGAWENALPESTFDRLKILETRMSESGLSRLPRPTPSFLALHAFSHALMRQLSFDCGYASSSLRERIYMIDGQRGLLIYTAAGDSEGTLGGLVRMGEPERLGNCMAGAIREMAWCSGDPICLETTGQGMSGLNEAACHACMLVSETSCECCNALLNRRLAIGDAGTEGLFSAAFRELEK